MPQILPIKELKNTSKISEMCHESPEPIYITKNGYGDMVIMSMEKYEAVIQMLSAYRNSMSNGMNKNDEKIDCKNLTDVALLTEKELDAELAKGYTDMIEGRTRTASQVLADIHEEYNI